MMLLEFPSITFEGKGKNKKMREMTISERGVITNIYARCFADLYKLLPDDTIEINILKNLSLARVNSIESKLPLSRINRASILTDALPKDEDILPYIKMRILDRKLKFLPIMDLDQVSTIIDSARNLKKLMQNIPKPYLTKVFETMYVKIVFESAKHYNSVGQRKISISQYQNCLSYFTESEAINPNWSPFDPIWKAETQGLASTEISRMLMEEGLYKEAREHLVMAIEILDKSLNSLTYLSNFAQIELLCMKANLSLIQEDYSESSNHIGSILNHLRILPSDIKKISDIGSKIPFSSSFGMIGYLINNRKELHQRIDDLRHRVQRITHILDQTPISIILMIIHFTYLKNTIDQFNSEPDSNITSPLSILFTIPEISNFHHLLNQACESQFESILSLFLKDDIYPNIVGSLREDCNSVPDILFIRDSAALFYSLIGFHTEKLQRPESYCFFKRSIELIMLELKTKCNVVPYSAFSVINSYCIALSVSIVGSQCSAREFLNLVHDVDAILLKLEAVRCTYIETDDRARLEALLETAYSELSASLFLHLTYLYHTEQDKATAVRAMLGFHDRSRLRWAMSLMPNSKPFADFSSKIPNEMIADYLSAKRSLVLSRSDFFSIQLNPSEVGIPEIEAIASKILSRKINKQRKSGSIPIDFDPDSFQGRKSEDKYVSQCLLAFREATRKIQNIEPLFEADLISNHAHSILECFETNQAVAHLHIQILESRIVVAIHHQSTNFFVLSPTESRSLTILEAQVTGWLAPIDYSFDEYSTINPFESSSSLIDFTQRLSDLLDGLAALCVKHLKIFLDPQLSWLPVHLLRIRNLTDCHYLFEVFHLSYSPSLSLTQKSEPEVPTKDLNALVASIGQDLPFAKLEGCATWTRTAKTVRLFDHNASFQNIVTQSRDAYIFHYCGHTRSNQSIIDHHLDTAGLEKLSVRRCLDTVRLLNSPLVVINACRASLLDGNSADQPPIPTANRQVRFEEGLATEQLSLSTAFLLSGASVVIATIAEVGDLPAALFMWKFSEVYQLQNGVGSSASAFRSATEWLREGIKSGTELEERIYPQFLAEASNGRTFDDSFIELCNKDVAFIANRFPDSPPFAHPRHWGAFVLHR